MKLLFLIGVIVLLVIMGTHHLFFPRRMQEDELRDLTGIRARLPFVRRFVESRQYLLHSRIAGLVCYLIAVVLLIGLLNHGRLPVRW